MRKSWAFIKLPSSQRKSVLKNLRRCCAASSRSRKRWKISWTGARLSVSWTRNGKTRTYFVQRTFPCEEWNKGDEMILGNRPQWHMASFETDTKRSEQRLGRAITWLTDKIRSNGNPFTTFSSLLLRFRPLSDSSRQFLPFLFRCSFYPSRSSFALAILVASCIYTKRNLRVIMTLKWHFEWTEELLRSMMD